MALKTASAITFAALVTVSISGCVALWGKSYNEAKSDANGISLQYDHSLSSTSEMTAIANQHCQKYGKTAKLDSSKMPGVMVGIIEESYSCVK